MLGLRSLQSQALPGTLKGLPASAEGRSLESLGSLSLSLLDQGLPLPAAILKESALAHNSKWMKAFTERAGVSICPHGKTTMAPQLFRRQLDDGAWGITAATATQVRTCRRFGVPRILLANQLVGRADFEIVFDELESDPAFDFYMLVDSAQGLDQLQRAIDRRPLSRPLQVLLEVGTRSGRTGVRTVEQGIELGRMLRDAGPSVALRGIEAFEGIAAGRSSHRVEFAVLSMLEVVADLAFQGCGENWFAPGDVILSAGGSAFFDLVARVLPLVEESRRMHVVLRSGCYLTHDSFHYGRLQSRMRRRSAELWGEGPGMRNALEVWAYVQSTPEAGRAICTLGKRDVSYDMELPQPLWWFRPGAHNEPQAADPKMRVTALNDQHAYVDAADGSLAWQVGDLIGFGIAHPCTTFDKWPLLYLVDDDYRVLSGIRTFF